MKVIADRLGLNSVLKTFMGPAQIKQLTRIHGDIQLTLIFMEANVTYDGYATLIVDARTVFDVGEPEPCL